jgi:hypothetical protein
MSPDLAKTRPGEFFLGRDNLPTVAHVTMRVVSEGESLVMKARLRNATAWPRRSRGQSTDLPRRRREAFRVGGTFGL